ncbi:hypothetical protein H4R20_000521 [Coemansia guatemalensis]|uniref:Uncharacterized protein n=1 Tax=Coemansia guatemalensis TaxID=2761395 RepID=A0A9W8HYQ6_9FUNG|nr:hypothetical protein H4R20_000521 [Coemansia guatemalensis]
MYYITSLKFKEDGTPEFILDPFEDMEAMIRELGEREKKQGRSIYLLDGRFHNSLPEKDLRARVSVPNLEVSLLVSAAFKVIVEGYENHATFVNVHYNTTFADIQNTAMSVLQLNGPREAYTIYYKGRPANKQVIAATELDATCFDIELRNTPAY